MIMVIPQIKKSYRTIFVKLSLNVPYVCFQAKKIGLSACLGDMKSQTYPIYTCTGTNQVHYFIASQCILLLQEVRLFKVTLEKTS